MPALCLSGGDPVPDILQNTEQINARAENNLIPAAVPAPHLYPHFVTGEECGLQSEDLNCFQDTDGISCRSWKKQEYFSHKLSFNILNTHGSRGKVSTVSCCFQLDLPAGSQFQSNTQQVLEDRGQMLKDDSLAELVSDSSVTTSVEPVCCSFNWDFQGITWY